MKSKRNFWIIFFLLLVVHAIVILSVRYFPFADVASHLAEGTIYKYYNEASNKFNEYYTLHYFFYPNTFHLFFFSLPIFSSVEVANRVLHFLIITSLPLLVYLIIREINGNRWFALTSFVLIYGYNLTFGFTGNALANDVILLILWLWLRTIEKRSNHLLNMIGIAAFLIVVYFSHAMVALFGLMMVGAFLLYRYKNNFGKLVLNSFSLLPLGALIAYWWFFLQKSAEGTTEYTPTEVSTGAFMKEYYAREFWVTYLDRVKFLVADNAQLFAGIIGKVVALLLTLIIVVPIAVLLYQYFVKRSKTIPLNSLLDPNNKFTYIIIFFFVSLGCYFILPSRIPGQEPLYERFSTILLFALIFIGSKIPEFNSRFFAYAATLVAVLHLALWAQYLYQFNQENKNFAQVFPQDNSKVLSYMNYDPFYRGRMVYDHYQCYYIIQHQGITTSKIIDYRFGMIRRKESGGLPSQERMYFNENPRKLLQKADYLLVRGKIPANHQRILDSLNTFTKVKDVDNWHLLKRKSI
ncbi:hypothetical protein [Hymenobacter sp. GOD-10R]|uniref:hypothetical protein n=1 Tax=Hymenobacter sp. GOD-10R TaxID=3093922 RepID=UPI002D79FD7C|nr:hypothetical protein [Hymenobacter sp. GOD-10R]WRQ30281.1 hypothetical protein SD425_08410 [Hymenobacter sp. GOD-10R]